MSLGEVWGFLRIWESQGNGAECGITNGDISLERRERSKEGKRRKEEGLKMNL